MEILLGIVAAIAVIVLLMFLVRPKRRIERHDTEPYGDEPDQTAEPAEYEVEVKR